MIFILQNLIFRYLQNVCNSSSQSIFVICKLFIVIDIYDIRNLVFRFGYMNKMMSELRVASLYVASFNVVMFYGLTHCFPFFSISLFFSIHQSFIATFISLHAIQGFDEYMNLVLDDAVEIFLKKNSRKNIGI